MSDRENNVIQMNGRSKEREVVLPDGSTATVRNVMMNTEEFSKMKTPPGYVEGKSWRTHVLRFYDKEATFEYDDRWLNHVHGVANTVVTTDFEPCVMGAVVSTDDGELVFRTDSGHYRVQYGGKLSLRRMLHRMDVDKDGICQTFCKLFNKSVKRHGWVHGDKVNVISSNSVGGEE